jgi:ABC-type uncharacterized transport system substrate-binding protein
MKRRVFLQLAGSAASLWSLPAWTANQSKLPLVALIAPIFEGLIKVRIDAVRAGLKEAGLVEGTDYVLAVRVSNGDNSRLPELAKELYALKPRVFVTAANAIVPVLQLPRDTPIVFTGFAADPIKLGLVQSYPKPGGMITGNVMNAIGGEESLTEKRIGFFKELVPNLTRLGMIGVVEPALGNRQDLSLSSAERSALEKVSAKFGFAFTYYPIETIDDLDRVFAVALSDGTDAIYVSGDPLMFGNLPRVLRLVMAAGKPSVGPYPEWAKAGLLMSYSTDALDGYRHAGLYAAKIIEGAKPGDLPVEQASKFTLVINQKTAKALGITVPPTLLALADEVIE